MHIDALPALVELDRRAVEATVVLVEGWDPADAARPTPCAGWTITDLVAHLTVQQHGFARAVAGERTVLGDWVPAPHDDPVRAYAAACDAVRAAFAGLTDPTAPVLLPEVRAEPLPTTVVVGFHLVDNVVHAWDLAAALGVGVSFDPDVLAAALEVARAVPDDERRDRDGAAFAHRLPVEEEDGMFDRILLLLGRDPAWSAQPVAGR